MNWYTATTPPQAEARAARHLAQRGIQHLILHLVERVTRRGRTTRRQRPAFPRYIFAAAASPSTITATPGISGLVTVAGRPATLAQATIDSLVARTNGHGLLRPPPRQSAAPRYAPGACVRVTDGPMTGFQGIVLSASQGVAVVRLGTLGRITVSEHLLGPPRHQARHRPRRSAERTPRSVLVPPHPDLQPTATSTLPGSGPLRTVDVLRSALFCST